MNERIGRWGAIALIALGAACGGSDGASGNDDGDTGTNPRDTSRRFPDTDGDADADPDADGAGDTDNVPPVAVAGPDVAGAPERSFHFDGTESYDEDGQIVAWEWAMGNGTTLAGAEVDYTYPSAGVYTVTLTVTDDGGLTGTDSLLVDLVVNNDDPLAVIDGPIEVVMGEQNTWDGRASEDDIGIVEWRWNTGVDGDSAHTGQVLDYTYGEWEDRPYRLTLRVTDTDGAESVDASEIYVMAPPVALVTGPNEAFAGDVVTFDATTSYDLDDESPDALEGVRWSFGDGTETGPDPWFPVHTRPTHTYAAPGRYDVIVGVRDSDGIWRDSATHKIDIAARPNEAPTAAITADTLTVNECGELALDGRASTDDSDDMEALTFAWGFGDGTTATGIEVSHTWTRAGEYLVSLTARDTDTAEDTATVTVTVENVRPTAAFSHAPSVGDAGSPMDFDATGSSDHCEGPGEDRITAYRWDWGDGTSIVESSSPTASHTFASGGLYEVSLTVVDDGDPALAHTTVAMIDVDENAPPDAVITGGSAPTTECRVVSFTGSASVDDRDATEDLTYTWDFGDGESDTGVAVEHAFDREGVYTVTLTVRDTDGASTVATRDVTVANVRPTAAFTFAPDPGEAGVGVNFDASGSTDQCEAPDEDRIVEYRWDWGDGTSGTVTGAALASHVFAAGGTYTVTLTVVDDGVSALTHATARLVTIEQNQPPTPVITGGSAPVTECQEVAFSAASSTDDRDAASAMTYTWDFGDGDSADGLSAPHSYAREGTYTVTLTARDTDGATSTAVRSVTVTNVRPTAAFTFSPALGEAGTPVTFDASESTDHCQAPGEDRITEYRWNWGDGTADTVSVTPFASHTFTTGGAYTVTLTVVDDGDPALNRTVGRLVTIEQNLPPTAAAAADATAVDECTTVAFDGRSSTDDHDVLADMTYTWDFDDGTGGTGLDVTHVYDREGTYIVTLTVRDSEGLIDTSTVEVTVSNVRPNAAFTFAPDPAEAGAPVAFDAAGSSDHCQASGEDRLVEYRWDWGDGTADTASVTPLASHTFAAGGTYTVTLTVVDDGDPALTRATARSVTVEQNLPPTALITGGGTAVTECQAVALSAATSTDDRDAAESMTYTWDFGDGSSGSGLAVDHTYERAGVYTVTLTARDTDGATDTTTRDVTVTNVAPTAAFTFAPDPGEAGVAVDFDGTTSSDHCEAIGEDRVIEYRWQWGDGSPDTASASPLAAHTFSSGGVYSVTLVVTDDGTPGLTDGSTRSVTIEQNLPPTALITGGGTPVTECASVALSAAGSTDDHDAAADMTYTWDFGDGESGAGISVNHTYDREGVYTVTLTARDTDGATDVTTRDVTVTNVAPTAAFTFSPDPGEAGVFVNFDGTTSSDHCEAPGEDRLITYRWQWGDGSLDTVSTSPLTAHMFASGGVYSVTLIVTDDGTPGLTDGTTQSVTIEQNLPPTAVISGGAAPVTECENVALSAATSTDDHDAAVDMTYTWDFGDGESDAGISVAHTYDRAGVYTVTLTARDTDGATDVTTRDITVTNVAPTAAFTFSPDPGEAGVLVSFDGTTSSDFCEGPAEDRITAYQWDWGDGTVSPWSASPTASHTWTDGGVYTVTLTVEDDGDPALSGDFAASVTIEQNLPPTAVITASTTLPDECEFVSLGGDLSTDDSDAAADMTYSWDFGDGTFGGGMSTSHAYDREGTYTVELTVFDTEGESDVTTTLITVSNVAPTAAFEITPNPGEVDISISFDASTSSDHCEGPGEDRITAYQWDWGDGTMSTWLALPAASHTYSVDGPYDVTLTVRDDGDPMLTDSLSKRLTIEPPVVEPIVEYYDFSPAISYDCAFTLVSFSFSEFELTLDATTATVQTYTSGPNDMTGPRTTESTFFATNFVDGGPGGCDETYQMTGTINGDGTITFDLTADYEGDFCVDCVHQEWTSVVASPIP